MNRRYHPFTPLAALPALLGGWLALELRAAGANETLPLPKWTEEDVATLEEAPAALPLGGTLWPDGFDPDNILPPAPQMADSPDEPGPARPRTARGIGDNFLLFIPKPPQVVARALPADRPLTEVTRQFMEQSELIEPDAFLLDPHHLLAETQAEDLRRLLAYHVGQAQTSAYFLLLDAHEKLSSGADLSRLAGGRLTKEHACLAAFPVGQPWRARLFVTGEISANVKPGYLPGILEACVREAMKATDPTEQLMRFATQLSIRLIWMERAYPDLFATEEGGASRVPASLSMKAGSSRRKSSMMPESAHALVLADVSQPMEGEGEGLLSPARLWRQYGRQALLGVSALALLLACGLRWRRWRKQNRRRTVWMLPEVEAQPRFGGEHCGSGGVWMRYGS